MSNHAGNYSARVSKWSRNPYYYRVSSSMYMGLKSLFTYIILIRKNYQESCVKISSLNI